MIYLNIKASWDYLLYLYKYRFKFTISIILTIISLVFTIDDVISSFWGWLGLIGIILGALLALSDIKELKEDIDSLEVEERFNKDEIGKIIDKIPLPKGGRYYLIDDAICQGIRDGSK